MLKQEIQQTVNVSLKERDDIKVKVLRFLLSLIHYVEIDKHRELTDEEIQELIAKEIKKRKEAIEMFKRGKRPDLVADEDKQLAIITHYVPKQLSAQELQAFVDEAIIKAGDKGNTGMIIGLVMTQVKGRADGSLVAQLVIEKLQQIKALNS